MTDRIRRHHGECGFLRQKPLFDAQQIVATLPAAIDAALLHRRNGFLSHLAL